MCEKCKQAFDVVRVVVHSDDVAMNVLWEETCFPFDGETCLRQATEWVRKHEHLMLHAKVKLERWAQRRCWPLRAHGGRKWKAIERDYPAGAYP